MEVELLTVQLFRQTHYVVLYLSGGAPVIPEDSPRIRSEPVKERALSPHKYPYGPSSRGRGGDEPANSSGDGRKCRNLESELWLFAELVASA